jgi:biotin operon repressor
MNNGQHRTTLERVRAIVVKLQRHEPVNATTMAKDFDVSTKTINRDIEFLRKLGHDITYKASLHTYSYVEIPPPDDVLNHKNDPNIAPLLNAIDKALSEPRFFWDWEDELRAARQNFNTTPPNLRPSAQSADKLLPKP